MGTINGGGGLPLRIDPSSSSRYSTRRFRRSSAKVWVRRVSRYKG